MPPRIEIALLGSPEVRLAGSPLTGFRSSKVEALLYYLVVVNRPHTRSALAALFWADQPEQNARFNLNKSLSNLREVVGEIIVSERQRVSLANDVEISVDTHHLLAAIERFQHTRGAAHLSDAAHLRDALALYRGDFLEGFQVRDAPDFEHWLESQRTRLRESAVSAWRALAEHATESGDLAQAVDDLRRLLTLTPWEEDAHRRLMVILADSGQRGAALAQYESCRALLRDELDIEPDDETEAIARDIREGVYERVLSTPAPGGSAPSKPTSHSQRAPIFLNAPTPSTPFIGRRAELEQILNRLRDPACRLLTLVGPGGIGKSRLALEAVRQLANDSGDHSLFLHGIHFVSLTSVGEPAQMVTAIGEGVGHSFYAGVTPRQQLLDYLSEKQMLLTLDNLEHLLDGIDLLADILSIAPGVKLMATSRVALNLVETWFHPIAGMAFPHNGDDPSMYEQYDAMQLFSQNALRARPTFSLRENWRAAARICQLVEGMPLGIELAATWLKALSAGQIADEIERSMDILTSRQQNTPVRQRSVRAVFDWSWRMLSERQRVVLMTLAVHRGGFTAVSADAVASASLLDLADLVDNSLLQLEQNGRYAIHELLRQYAQEQLRASNREIEARNAHCRFYLDLLRTQETALLGRDQRLGLDILADEMDNIRTAWRWAVEQEEWEKVSGATSPLFYFCQIRSRYQEGVGLFSQAIQQITSATEHGSQAKLLALLYLTARRGALHSFLGNYQAGRSDLVQGLDWANELHVPRDAAFCLNFLGQLVGWQGDRQEALAFLERSHALYAQNEHLVGMTSTLHKMAQLHGSFGAYEEARRLAQESLNLAQTLGRPDWIAYAQDVLGWATLCLGDYVACEGHYWAGLAIFEESGDHLGIALALGGLGSVHWARGGAHLPDALHYMTQSLNICLEIGHRLHAASRLWYLAQINLDQEDYGAAQTHAREALAMADAAHSRVFTAYALCALGAALCGGSDTSAGERILGEAAQLAASLEQYPPLLFSLIYLAYNWARLADESDPSVEQPAGLRRRALITLRCAMAHPSCWHPFRVRAEALAARLIGMMSDEEAETAEAESHHVTVESLLSRLGAAKSVAGDHFVGA